MQIKFTKIFFLLFGFTFAFFSKAEKIKIRILTHIKINEFILTAEKGDYKILGEGRDTITLKQNEYLTFIKINDSIHIKNTNSTLGQYTWFKVFAENYESLFSIKSNNPERKKRFYEDNLIIGLDKATSSIRLINWIELDKYIAGVVEAEAGRKSHPEFYKVQAILARTYALSIFGRHIAEGHDLCDQVHCQAYYGRTKENDILNSVFQTKEFVVVDKDFNLINAVFHSNSGGQTANSEDVWGSPTTYLRSVLDTFSQSMPNYKWTRKMLKEDWLEYLRIKHKIPLEDSASKFLACNFNQLERKAHLDIGGKKIALKNIRNDLNLKSTFFEICTVNDSVIFKGKGYGHGIGMCQEGAMKMSKLGYKYVDIIKFYYRGIQIINRQQLAFFREN